jgi:hypothetical protein
VRAPNCTQRCAGEGELVLGLTEHSPTLAMASGGVNWQLLPASGAGLAEDTRGLLGKAYLKPQKATDAQAVGPPPSHIGE